MIIGKSMIEMPVQFKKYVSRTSWYQRKTYYRNTDGLSEDIIYFAKELSEMVYLKIGHLYPKLNLDKKNNPRNNNGLDLGENHKLSKSSI